MYPTARKGDVVDDLHGEKVADPYRWLEDLDSDETAGFVASQNELTGAVLSAVPSRADIERRLTELWEFPRASVPFERGGRWFQFRNPGLANQHTLHVMSSPDDEGRLLLDPNTLSPDGTAALSVVEVSPDGRRVAYSVARAGSDWQTWRVRDTGTGEDLDDVVEWSKFSGAAWLKDGSGFYYAAPDRPAPGTEYVAESRHLRLLLHRIATPQGADELFFEAPEEPEWMPHATTTEDGRFVVVSIGRGTWPESQIEVFDPEQPELGFRALVAGFEALAEVVGNEGESFFVLTDRGAERRRLVEIDLGDASPESWRQLIGETDDTLVGVDRCGDAFVCHYLHDACSLLRVHDLAGSFRHEVPLPSFCAVDDPDGPGAGLQASPRSEVLYCKTVSCLESGSTWAHDVVSGETTIVRPSASQFEPASCVTEQVVITSDDGTSVPVLLSRRRDVVPSGDVPVLMHGYGGFNVPNTPMFRTFVAVWLEGGGVFAETILRGGGEFGRSWNEAGKLSNKQNVFDDFAACARWFVSSGWSSPGRVAICGASNGGLLVGASVTQHPELFGAAVAEVGVLDMLRFHKFTIGWAWTSDFGDPDEPVEYQWARAYSPLHNLHPRTAYPATLIMTGDHDDRVVPGHSYKFAAAMQAAQGGEAPVLLRVETSAGHGLGKPTSKQIAERTDFLCFLELALGLPEPQQRLA
ncbi:MAG: prolyl oligopeptidase family serine peptidase [Acidimicrobiales bacterium]